MAKGYLYDADFVGGVAAGRPQDRKRGKRHILGRAARAKTQEIPPTKASLREAKGRPRTP